MKIKLVLVDDHSIFRQGIKMIVNSEADMEIVGEADSALDGLELIKTLKPDIAVLDVNLPNRNGFALLQDIQRSLPNLPVLFLTMHPEEIFAVRAMQSGAKGYLCKNTSSKD